ncbi:MAG: ABC transporter ATP-binding protein [Sedimentisphaerales bacterium]
MSEKVIEVENLGYGVRAKRILEGINFSVFSGRRLFIVGPNGAGKTTLLRCMSRIITDYAGIIRVKNKNIENYSHKNLAKILVYLPQSLPTDIPFTARQFVMMARFPHLSPFSIISPQDEKIVNNALDVTQTAGFADREMTTLSGGERQQVSIAAAVAQQAEILLLDEPVTYLDYKHQRDIHILLAKINKTNNTTIVCVTHDLNSAVLNADSIIALKEGKIAFEGMPRNIMNEDTLEEIYSKKFNFTDHPLTGQKIIIPDIIQ